MSEKQPIASFKTILATLGGIYTIQSIVSMFTMQSIPAILRTLGVSTTNIGLFSLLMMPWALKFLWAAYIEQLRKLGYTKVMILFGNLLIGFSFLLISLIDINMQIYWLIFCLIFITIGLTIVDTVGDGFAIDNLSSKHYSWANMMQVGGSYLGHSLGNGLFLYIMAIYSWSLGCMTIALFIFIILLPACFIKNRRSLIDSTYKDINHNQPSIKKSFKRQNVQLAILLIITCMTSTRFLLSMLMPFIIDKGFTLSELGVLNALQGAPAGLLGVVISSLCTRKWGAYQALIIILMLEIVISGLFLWLNELSYINYAVISIVYILTSLIIAAKFVAMYSLLMALAVGKQSGVDFAIMQSSDIIISIFLTVIAGVLVDCFSYIILFSLSAILGIIGLIYLFRQTPRLSSINNN